MKLGDAKRKALVLMREYTNDGRVIAASENADYLKSMDDLADQAQKLIAKKQKIHSLFVINPTTVGTPYGNTTAYDLPSNCLDLDRVEYVELSKPAELNPDLLYRWLTPRKIATLNGLPGSFYVYYFKNPSTITPNLQNETANDGYEFEIDEEAQELIPFYISAQLLMDEDASRGGLKLNEFHAKLEELETRDYYRSPKKMINTAGW